MTEFCRRANETRLSVRRSLLANEGVPWVTKVDDIHR